MRKILFFLLATGVIIFSYVRSNAGTKSLARTYVITEITPAIQTSSENWQYSSDTDIMTSKVQYYAQVPAKDGLWLKFPYEGATARLWIRRTEGSTDVMIVVSKGQIMAANSIGGGNIRVRFDDGEPETYHVLGASDGSSETIFISPVQKFLKKLKSSKKLIVEAEFYDNGTQYMQFNTANLVWNH